MSHSHSHSNGHNHHHGTENIKVAFFLNLAFTIVEIIGGFYTNSLAILSDAVHDLGDSFSLGLAWYLNNISEKGRSATFSYGYKRFSLLAAFITSVVLLIGSIFVLSEAIPRLMNPEDSNAQGMFWIALLGITVNGAAMLKVKQGSSMSERVVSLHFLEDVLGWVAVLVVSIITMIKDIDILDPLLSVGISCYVLWNVFKNLKETVRLFLQGVPTNIQMNVLENALAQIPKVKTLHDTHVWSLDGEQSILTMHIVVTSDASVDEIMDIKCKVKEMVHDHGVEHSTIEIEKEGEVCNLDNC